MNYLFSDYYFLCGAAAKETHTVGDAYRIMCRYLGGPSTCDCLLHALRGLTAGGYITVEPEEHHGNRIINLASPIEVTEAGRKAVAISALQKLFGERKAFVKNLLGFCTQERPDTTPEDDWWVDGEALEQVNHNGIQHGAWSTPLCTLGDVSDDCLSMTLHHGTAVFVDPDEDPDPDAPEQADTVTVTGDAARIMAGISDLLATAYALLSEPPRTRKVAIHGTDKSLVITLARVAVNHGSCFRMTAAQIRFNRQRFYGKRDGDLDYAQCGDPLITAEFVNAREFAGRLLPTAVALPRRLSEKDLANIHELGKQLL